MATPKIDIYNSDNWPYLLTCNQVAKILQISHTKAYQMAKKGELSARKFGKNVRIPRTDLINFIERSPIKTKEKQIK